jgi:pimeloyl-ACP methyl ester carboxylesterase
VLTYAHFKPRLAAIPTFDDDALRRLTMPVLLIAGARDVMLDAPETARRLRHTVPHASVTLLPEAGHILPDQAAAVLGFLREHKNRRGQQSSASGEPGFTGGAASGEGS